MTVPAEPTGSASENAGGVMLPAGDGRAFRIGGIQLTVKESGERTGGQLVIAEIQVAAGAFSPPPHVHRRGGESWYVLEGDLEVLAGHEKGRYGPGSFVMIPAGTPHRFANPGTSRVRFLVTMTPFHLRFLETVSELSASRRLRPAGLHRVMSRYDTQFVGLGRWFILALPALLWRRFATWIASRWRRRT